MSFSYDLDSHYRTMSTDDSGPLITRAPWSVWDLRSGEPAENASLLEVII
jgi:hypothetical protein